MSHAVGRAVEVQSDSLRATRPDSLGVTPGSTRITEFSPGNADSVDTSGESDRIADRDTTTSSFTSFPR